MPEEAAWLVYKPLPLSMRMHYIDPSGGHPLTPDIRLRYAETIRDRSLVLWRQGDRFGMKAGQDELAWEIAGVQSVTLEYWSPAKGPGQIWLSVIKAATSLGELPTRDAAVLSIGKFEPQILGGFVPVLQFLEGVLPGKVKQINQGIDF
ncbi:MAG: hypothetical protein JO250_04705 [Armatimonadetes bacterium]|nr:hypothetical protein [Armatimonadota bacterium]